MKAVGIELGKGKGRSGNWKFYSLPLHSNSIMAELREMILYNNSANTLGLFPVFCFI
jgi:hypothetical protein